MTMTFDQLREANARRLSDFERAYPNDLDGGMSTWSPAEWTNALAGETGELCNKTKKLRRGQGISTSELADEAADVAIYLDLCCQKLGFTLEEAIRRKFNDRSKDIGSEVRL